MTGRRPSAKSRRRAPATEAPGATGSPLRGTRRFEIPHRLAVETMATLQRAGRRGHEAFVLWGALTDGTTIQFQSMYVPEQQGHQTPDGLLVTVDGTALFDVNRALYAHREVLAAQVHSHPTGAYHSETDDCYALVTLAGALSIVVPNFGAGGTNTTGWAWYRLIGPATFEPLDRNDEVLFVQARD